MTVRNPVRRCGSPIEWTLLDVVNSIVVDEAGLRLKGISSVLIDDTQTVDTSPEQNDTEGLGTAVVTFVVIVEALQGAELNEKGMPQCSTIWQCFHVLNAVCTDRFTHTFAQAR